MKGDGWRGGCGLDVLMELMTVGMWRGWYCLMWESRCDGRQWRLIRVVGLENECNLPKFGAAVGWVHGLGGPMPCARGGRGGEWRRASVLVVGGFGDVSEGIGVYGEKRKCFYWCGDCL